MERQPSGVHLLLPHVPFATLQNHIARVSLSTMPQAHGDPGSPTPPSTDESPKRQVPPEGHVPAMGRAWTPLLHHPRLQDAQSHWVSVASHFPAACGCGGRRTSFPPWRARALPEHPLREQVTLHPHRGKTAHSRIQGKVAPAPSLELMVVGWVFPPPGATRRDATAPGAAAIAPEQQDTRCRLSSLSSTVCFA